MAAGPSPIVPSSRAKTAAYPGRTAGAPVVEEVVEEHVTPPAPPKGRKVVEVYEDDEDDEDAGQVGPDGYRTVIVRHPKRSAQPPPPRQTGRRWFGGRF